MNEHAELLKEIDKLPPQYFGEVVDFVGYLRQKAKNGSDAVFKADAGEWQNPLLGLAKAKGATLTLDRFMEMQREENARENENDRRLWGKQ